MSSRGSSALTSPRGRWGPWGPLPEPWSYACRLLSGFRQCPCAPAPEGSTSKWVGGRVRSSELACQQDVLHRLPTLRQVMASDMSQVEGPPEAGARTSHGSWLLPLLVTQGARRAGRREQASRQHPPRQTLATDNNESPAPSPSPELEPLHGLHHSREPSQPRAHQDGRVPPAGPSWSRWHFTYELET